MRHVAAFLMIIAAIVAGVYAVTNIEKPGATVKVMLPAGHGSGIHIGDGYIISAAHVIGNAEEVTIKLDDQSEQSATVLWVNKTYDVALLRTEQTMNSAKLSCRAPELGELVYAEGNPLNLEFIRTNGKVAGVTRNIGNWKSATPVDMTIIMGMSGGPVFDPGGHVIGINIGVAIAPLGMVPSLTGIGVIVPGRTICDLLARS